jgi:hypothetical protein
MIFPWGGALWRMDVTIFRHREERSDEAIQELAAAPDCFAPLAMAI